MKVTFNFLGVGTAIVAALTGCGDDPAPVPSPDGPPSTVVNASDVPIDGLSADDIRAFDDGDALFGLPFRPADGLGPLFIRTACAACHAEGSRGPGLVQKMAIVEADGVTPSADQSALAFGHTLRLGRVAGATTPIEPPPDVDNLKLTVRVGPPILGRGYLEAIDDAEILRVEAEQATRSDGIHGKAVHLPAGLGKFGLKARIATLDEFTADAFQGDMGLTTPLRPTELPNPDGLTDDDRPGVDLDQAHIDRVAFYMRRIAIPVRVAADATPIFAKAQCNACHVPTLKTRTDYEVAQLAGIDAPIYSDLLLHDMGRSLADGLTDEGAASTQWRTAPLIGLRFMRTYLHDGRATSVEDAIRLHDGEARGSRDAFEALSPSERAALVAFVEAL